MEFRSFDVDKDLDLYIKGDIAAFQESFPGVSLPAHILSEISNTIKLLPTQEGTRGITALDASYPIGFVIASIQMFYLVPFVYIESIYVEPEYREKGIADQLLTKAEAWGISQGAKFVQLDVSTGNESAKKVYERLGYANTRMKMEKFL